jgi:metallo-beta-lactamase class B
MRRPLLIAVLAVVALPITSHVQDDPLVRPYSTEQCPACTGWNAPQRPVHLFGNTYYVGTHGLASLLLPSPDGHVVIDGGLPDSAPMILANIRALGFAPADVKLILNSHAHFDHSGGTAALQRASGARVAASPASAAVIRTGMPPKDDPQHGLLFEMPPVPAVEVLTDGKSVSVGSLTLTPHFTSGHAPGGTSWTWQSCEGERCLSFVYADSQTPISRDGFLFSRHPDLVAGFERSVSRIEQLPCDVLITPHPGASGLWERLAPHPDGLIDSDACRRYAANARQQLKERLEREAR